ncbi:peptidyl-glycine alpha-amidating monooxygenase B [Trichonephila clavipes]|nr:peptidyl-glycine alpha-amidating monooxygenase B [Trichonephila clavipes]
MESGRFRFQIQREEFGGTLYSITYAQEKGKFQQSYFGNLRKVDEIAQTPHPRTNSTWSDLYNPHKGFDQVSLEESDADGDDGSESDIEEYSAIARKT